ncbi:TPA: GIY-YIG nuclease family protein [Vibrio cholerae]|uniref:GIY-YIG nuclease family protein n=1 Tax=Vibrio cholerae TaxID=666 RepID=UPI000BB54077|nr:GIY-YIG nuclease family protein [Vibrio cholerae]ATD29650.1 URI domain containing putative endonuclease [Vibrio cholerae]EGR0726190.1 GIY-YIG nuclease family protein [Vibrio cholerae]EII5633964.1 GIY-YIG nuclease family protein [Vibrio cholerae]ELH8889386.1 GIY-YIG nuclease family protein [Vibrio cholerae]NOF50691.1 GIY-YIG nuclease family protein [Vibrio cholerae]
METLAELPAPWFVYLVRCANNALYCGITTDVARRFAQHQKGNGAKALRGKGPLELVWSLPIAEGKSAALKLEYRIKALSKSQKEALVTGIARIEQLDIIFQ